MSDRNSSPEIHPRPVKKSGRAKTIVALSALSMTSALFGAKQAWDALSHDSKARAAFAAGDTETAYRHKSATAGDLNDSTQSFMITSTALAGLLLTTPSGKPKPGASADTAQPPRLSGQLYDGPDTTHHAEPPAEAVQARVEVPLTPPIEWQPPQPTQDSHAVYRRPQ